jgi:hypothetical protein
MEVPLSKRIRRSVVAVVCFSACAVAASPAQALYYPSGPQTFVDKSKLDGWQLCFSDKYNDDDSLDPLLASCNKDLLMLAGGPTDSQVLTVLAAAPRSDVLFDTGHSSTPHDANGTGWYFARNWSWGFAKQGDVIDRNECDVAADQTPGANPDLRLCWHTFGPDGGLSSGYRAGAEVGLNTALFTRYVYQAPRPSNAFTARTKGKNLLLDVSAVGDVTAVDAKAPLSASTAKKKKRILLLKPSGGSGNPPTISVPLHLTKTAKQKLRQKGKVTVKARITFTPSQGGLPNTQTAKLKIKGKAKKK